MKVLVVAPQPFYEERGTPIAVRLLAETLCEFGYEVDLLVYHCGEDVSFPGLRLIRAGRPPGVRHVPIGISIQKLACDVWLVARMIRLLRGNRYDVIHSVEEAVFPAVLLNVFSNRRLVYDMDSSLADQLTDKWWVLRPLRWLLVGIERLAVGRAAVVLPVCEDLAAKVRPWIDPRRVIVIPDVPVGDPVSCADAESLRAHADPRQLIGLYVGNLERYQGIDLLLECIAELDRSVEFKMLVIGGSPVDVQRYRKRALDLGIAERIAFLGPRPVAALNGYLAQADVLVSPRILGQNTPMKVYSYMQAGKAIVATGIRSHTQALDAGCAELVAPESAALAAGIERVVGDAQLRERLGQAARAKAEREYSLSAYRERLRQAYELVER